MAFLYCNRQVQYNDRINNDIKALIENHAKQELCTWKRYDGGRCCYSRLRRGIQSKPSSDQVRRRGQFEKNVLHAAFKGNVLYFLLFIYAKLFS
jgi:hypothetical protein